ncbi:MAG: isopeptide-forming domain-containing fimbrial protein, partial [Planctomycetaceae bacterium]
MPAEAFLGEEFCFDTRFTNTGDPGFGPYFRLTLPPQLEGLSATVFGASIGGGLQSVGTFPSAPAAPELIDPRIGEAVTGTPGFIYYNVVLPVGSVIEGGPELNTTICATISPDAIVDDPLLIAMTPIYQFGATATGVNGPIIGPEVEQDVTPTVLLFSKSNNAPEGERATGPSWPYTYTLDVDIANTATINPITISDTLPPDFQYLDGTASVTGGAGCSITQVPSTVSLGGSLEVACAGNTIGEVGSGDIVVRYSGYVVDVLDQNVCTAESIVNSATVAATYIDQEGMEIPLPEAPGDSTVTAEHVAIQKSVSPGQVAPGADVTYGLAIQVSDFGTINSLVITDVIADGIDFDTASVTFSVNGGDPIAVTPTVTVVNDTTVVIDLFEGTGLTEIAAGSAIFVNYAGTVRETYRETNERVVASDALPNSVTIRYSLTAGASDCTEGSAASTVVRPVNSSKTIFNPQDFYQPGDPVIYRLRLDIPSGDTRGIRFVDYLPLPALRAGDVTPTFSLDSADCPAPAGLCLTPNDTAGLTPTTITADTALNAIVIEWPDVQADEPRVIEVDLYTTVTDDPFADGLFLTNIVLVETNNTLNQTATNVAPVPVNVNAPRLEIDKAVSATSGAGTVTGGNLTDADAGDTVTYGVTLTNTGGAPAFNVTVTDPPPDALESCSAASVQVAGSNRTFAGDLSGGLEIDGQVSAGESAVITYTCTLAQSVTPRQVIENEAVATWASQSGSAAFPAIRDDATVTIASPGIAKTSTDVSPGPASPNAVPGDIVTYQLTVTVPEGTTPGLVITDQLPGGFEYVAESVSLDSTGFLGTVERPNVDGTPGAPQFQFGDVIATGTADTANNSFVVTYQARVLNVPANAAPVNPQPKTNTAALNFTDNPGAPVSASSTLLFREPNLTIAKSFSPASNLVAGQQVTITFTLRNTGTAPAFDLSIEDILNDGAFNDLLDLTSVLEGDDTPVGFDFGYDEVTGRLTYTAVDPATSLAPDDDPLVFTITANVLSDVVTGSVYSNTVTATGYSQSQPQPDADGEDQRRPTEAEDTATVNVATATVTKALAATSEDFTSGSNMAIGETFTYTIGFELPPGVTRAVRLADVITNGFNGVELVGATLARSSEDLTAFANPGGINGAATDSAVPVGLTTVGNAFVVDLGDVNNFATQAERYTLRVTLRVANVEENTQNRPLRDRGRIFFADAAGTERNVQSPQRTVTVRLPVVGIQKTVSPSSPAAGDTVTYTLTITNTGNATGFEWTFEDVLPSELINPGALSWDVGGTGATVNAAFDGNILSGTIDALAPGGSIEVSYQATIDPNTGFGTSVTNSAEAAMTSLPPDSENVDNRRTGEGGVNDLFGSDTAPLTTARPTLVKSVVTPQSRYAIGDVIHYRLEEGVPVGTTNDLVVFDDLPDGVIFLDQEPYQPVLTLGAGLTSDGSGISFDAVQNRMVVDLGTLTATQPSSVTVDYFVQVDNVLVNQDGVTLTNEARARFEDPQNPGGDPIELGPRSVSVTLGEPRLVLAKSIPSGGVGLQAGDPVDWRIVIENTGSSTAWQTELRDVLPTGAGALDLDDITVAVLAAAVLNADGDPVSVDDVQIQTTFDPDDTLLLEGLSLSPGARLQIDFRTRLEDDVVFGEILVNEAIATFASQPEGSSADSVVRDSADALDDPAGLNDYRATASTALTIASDLAIGKTVDRNQATIGEELTYTIRLSLITGVTENVFVSDELPDGLAYVSHNISVGHMGIGFGNPDYNERLGAGQLVQFDLGNVSNPPSNGANDNFVEIDITARVTNVAANENGVVFSNGEGGTVWVEYGSADEPPERLTFDADPSNPDTISGIPVTVVEPALDVSKSVAPSEQALGNEVVFTVDLAHASGSSATAFDLVIRDLLPDGLSFVAGSASLPDADISVDGQELEFRFSTLELGQERSFSYRALVDPTGPVGAELANALGLTWTSLPGSSGAEDSGRTGEDGPEGELNNYAQNSEARVTVTADAFLYAVKTVAIAVDGGVIGQVDPGDTLEYTIVITNT